jgi:hypothetical protein
MIKRLSVVLVLSLFVAFIFAGGAFGATAKGKANSTSANVPLVSDAAAPVPYKYAPQGGINYKSNCLSIAPENGIIIEHTQVGDTWYDFQKNGSIGRMISVSSDGYRHISWMYTAGIYPGVPRYVKGNCEPAANGWIGAQNVDGGATNAGYSNQTNLFDGTSLVIYHRTAGTPIWNCAITADDYQCGGFFSRHWDIPDYILNAPSGQAGEWPKFEVQHDTGSLDYIHVVMTEGNTAGGVPVMVAYERCWIKDSTGLTDPMYCQSYRGGATQTYRMLPGVAGGGSFSTISYFDSSCSITPVVAVSPVSKRVAIAFLKPADPAGSCDYMSDVAYIESMHLGDDWINGTNWPSPEYKITHYGTGSGERAFSDVSACYDYQDSLHVIWSTAGFDSTSPGSYIPSDSHLYHWSKKSGISAIAQQVQGGLIQGAHNSYIAKMSISASDPIYHPGGTPDSVYLWAIWTQFDTADVAANGFGNGDIKGSGSVNGGATWGGKYNLTNTHTPNCAAGACLSEHWSSMSQNMWNGDLHIEYVCDQDAGGAIQDTPSQWMDNPMMYLRLTEWPVTTVAGISVRVISPSAWNSPPLKITPGGSRTLTYRIYSTGNGNLTYSVTSDNSCISANVPGSSLAPRDSATYTAIVQGSGPCNNSFISGNIKITHNDPSQPTPLSYPVQAVVSNDYYECPRDLATNDTLKNGVFNFYINANGGEWVHDTSFAADTTHEVFFQGGAFIATKISGDTLVGRYYGTNDEHSLAQVDLKQGSYTDFWLEYTWNVSIHDLNPPVDNKWWWFDMLHENVFFKSTASSALKHTVIKFVTAERHSPPVWWPSQPTFTGYEDTYIGMMMDIDCPWDSLGSQNGRNRAGWDGTNKIAYQQGWDYTGAHPGYNNYYAGLALAQGFQAGESTTPWGTYNLRNDVYLYPQSPWGWKDGDFYRLAAGNVPGDIQQPDSIVDRSQILTARKIAAGSNASLKASFTVIEAVNGDAKSLAGLQANVAAARAWVAAKPFILCGDANGSGVVEVGDVVTLLNYLFKGFPASTIAGPFNRADDNNSGAVEVGDVVTLLNYLFKGFPASTIKCPGVW